MIGQPLDKPDDHLRVMLRPQLVEVQYERVLSSSAFDFDSLDPIKYKCDAISQGGVIRMRSIVAETTTTVRHIFERILAQERSSLNRIRIPIPTVYISR